MYETSKPYKTKIKKLISSTWNTPYLSIDKGVYSKFKEKIPTNLSRVDHTDGIGTKGVYHWQKRTFKSAVIDALAMNLNDLALIGATPYKLQNHLTLPEDDHKAIIQIIKTLSEECKKRDIAITGGETSIHNNIEGMDISMTVSGFIKKEFKNEFKDNDIIFGLKSNGLHSNGFTLIRKLFDNQFHDDFTNPTKIYLEQIKKVQEKVKINAMMNITGGGFTKLKDILKNDQTAKLDKLNNIKPPPIYNKIARKNINSQQMYKTFNCGIGFIFSTDQKYIKKVLKISKAKIIGKIIKGNRRMLIKSQF